jgi:hypothetical protein
MKIIHASGQFFCQVVKKIIHASGQKNYSCQNNFQNYVS